MSIDNIGNLSAFSADIQNASGRGGIMQTQDSVSPGGHDLDIQSARDALQLMLIEYGEVHIETLGQLLRITRVAEEEYSRICVRRFCG